jgi:hypothetical protein
MRRLAATLALLAAAGCKTTVGHDYSSEALAELALGRTSADELRAWFGAPDRRVTLRGAAGKTEVWYFQWAHSEWEGASGRTLGVELADGVVIGWLFDSSFAEDSTEFDASRRAELVPGESGRADVERLIGPPGGRLGVPSNLHDQELEAPPPAGTSETWAWRASETYRWYGMLKTRVRLLAVYLDDAGLVVGQRYRSDRDD